MKVNFLKNKKGVGTKTINYLKAWKKVYTVWQKA